MFSGNKMKSIFSGMEARYKCCQSIHKAFVSSSKLLNDPALAGLAAKVRNFFFFFGGGGGCSRITNQLLLKMQETVKVAKSCCFFGW